MSKPGVIVVPSPMPKPENREVALAILRAFATHGEFIGPNTVRYVPFDFWKSFAYIIDIKQVELEEIGPNEGAGYPCTYRVLFHMTPGGSFAQDASPQMAIIRNVFAQLDKSEPELQTTLVLTPSGWRSPEVDQAISTNSLDIFFHLGR